MPFGIPDAFALATAVSLQGMSCRPRSEIRRSAESVRLTTANLEQHGVEYWNIGAA